MTGAWAVVAFLAGVLVGRFTRPRVWVLRKPQVDEHAEPFTQERQ